MILLIITALTCGYFLGIFTMVYFIASKLKSNKERRGENYVGRNRN